ncbi:MAG: (Fe-S)-binding protein, partial [Desulfohalobiaceae bacterium]
MAQTPSPKNLVQSIDHTPPQNNWMDDTPPQFRLGNFSYPAKSRELESFFGYEGAKEWSPMDEDWQLPENWQEIIYEGFRERLEKYRSLKVFMDICVRCGACADKCHYFIGSGDPKNMPVLRAELLRSVYRKDFTTAGKILGKLNGGRELTQDVIKEWFMYFYQCTECRRCSLFCPY